MQAVWGAKFTANIAEKEIFDLTINEWYCALIDLTDKQIVKAYEHARATLKFPPTPVEMREFALDIVSTAKAYDLASSNKNLEYRHLLPSWEWDNLSGKEIQQAFYAAYNNFRDQKLIPLQKNLLETKKGDQ